MRDSKGAEGPVEVVEVFENAALLRLLPGATLKVDKESYTFSNTDIDITFEGAQLESPFIINERDSSRVVAFIKESARKIKGSPDITIEFNSDNYFLSADAIGKVYRDYLMTELTGRIKYSGSLKATLLDGSLPLRPKNRVVVFEKEDLKARFISIQSDSHAKISPVIAEIVEIEVLHCRYRYLYCKPGRSAKGLKPGLYGLVYEDRELTEVIGKIEIVEIYSRIFKARIITINKSFKVGGLVKFEVDPRYYIE